MAKEKNGKEGREIDGMKEASSLLAGLDGPSRDRILKEIAQKDPAMAAKLKSGIFTFAQVLLLPPVELFKVAKSVSSDLLTLSLRGLDPQLLDDFLKGFSERQAKAIRDEMLSQGPRKLSEVQVAQEKVLEIAKALHESGEITLKRR